MADELNAGATQATATANNANTNEEVTFDETHTHDDMDSFDYLGEDDEQVTMSDDPNDAPNDMDEWDAPPKDMTNAVEKKPAEDAKPEKAELTQQDIEYGKIMKLLENPDIIAAIKAVQEGKAQPQQNQQSLEQVADQINFSEEELADPVTFGKSILNKVKAEVSKEIASAKTAMEQQLEPLRQEYGKMMFEKECAGIVKEFGADAKAFVTKNTPEFEALKDKFLANPTLSLRDAFLLVRPITVNKMVEKGVSSAIDRGREQSLRVNGNKTPMSAAPRTNLTAREAVIQAFRDNGISF